MKPHPAAAILRQLTDAEYGALVANMRENGLLEDIETHDGQILDGNHRYRACREIGIEPRFKEWRPANGVDPYDYVISKHLHRRDHTREQKREIVVKLLMARPEHTDNHIANLVGVDHKTVSKVRTECEANWEIPNKPERKEASGRKARGPKPGEKKRNSRGNRAALPDGLTPEDATRRGLELEAKGHTTEQAANQIGIDRHAYNEMRKVVALAIRDDLSEQDRLTVESALKVMNETEQYGPAVAAVAPIAQRVWGKKATWGLSRSEARRMKNFERAYAFVVDACLHAKDIDIPYLSAEKAKEVAEEVKTAEEAVRTLRKRIMEYANV